MILPYTKIVGLPIFDMRGQAKVGMVKDVIIQVKDFKVSGLMLENSFFDRKSKVINSTDIIEISSQGVIVENSDSVSSADENVRLKEAIHSGYCGVGQKVVTKSGKLLGRVLDFFVSSETLEITKILVKNIFSEKIISSTAIVEIKKRKIVVKDNFETIIVGTPVMETSGI